jgi:hypothetical protein
MPDAALSILDPDQLADPVLRRHPRPEIHSFDTLRRLLRVKKCATLSD